MNHDNNQFGIAVKSFYFLTGNDEPTVVKASFLCTGTQYQYRYTTKTTKRTRAQLDIRESFRVFEQPTRRFCWCDGRRRDSDEKEMNLKDATCHAR